MSPKEVRYGGVAGASRDDSMQELARTVERTGARDSHSFEMNVGAH